MSRSVTLRFRVTPGEADEIRRRAGGAPVSEWLRRLALGEDVAADGREGRWATLRAEVRGLLRAQSRQAVDVLAQGEGARCRALLRVVGRSLELGRDLSPQEEGIVAAEARALLERPPVDLADE